MVTATTVEADPIGVMLPPGFWENWGLKKLFET